MPHRPAKAAAKSRKSARSSTTTYMDLAELPRERLERMAAAGREVIEVLRVLGRTNDNVVGEILRHQGTFYEWNHYPKGDVYDDKSHGQYFYHAHPTGQRDDEHGHFHTFVRAAGMPPHISPAKRKHTSEWPKGDEALSHVIGISMDSRGNPLRLFAANRWVTGETWYKADDVCELVDRFSIDHAQPSWPTNRWVSGMVALFWPQVMTLVQARDTTVTAWEDANPDADVLEDRRLEVTSQVDISVEQQIKAIEAALGARRAPPSKPKPKTKPVRRR